MLHIVDLAGNERTRRAVGQRLEEAKRINRSIAALGNCIASLAGEHGSHVPYRDSMLTRLLTDSLGGNAKTRICASPAAGLSMKCNWKGFVLLLAVLPPQPLVQSAVQARRRARCVGTSSRDFEDTCAGDEASLHLDLLG